MSLLSNIVIDENLSASKAGIYLTFSNIIKVFRKAKHCIFHHSKKNCTWVWC